MAKSQREQTGVPEDDTLQPLVPEPAAAAQDDGRPDWLPENFKDEAAFAASYKELERTLTQSREEIGRLQEQYELLAEQAQQQPRQQQPQYDPNADPMLNAYAQALEAGDYQQAAILNAAISAQVAQAAAQQHLQQAQQVQPQDAEAADRVFALLTDQQLAARFGDEWDTLKEGVADIVQAKPYLLPDTRDPVAAADALADVANMVRANQLLSSREETTAAQQAASRQQKLLAQTMTGGGTRIVDGGTDKEQMMEAFRKVSAYPYGSGR